MTALTRIPDLAWRARARCSPADAEMFFADDPRAAVAMCRACPVIRPCARWALANPSEQGVLGGLTERRRRAIRKRMAVA